jgi:preprotein translocase subunit Sec61beta
MNPRPIWREPWSDSDWLRSGGILPPEDEDKAEAQRRAEINASLLTYWDNEKRNSLNACRAILGAAAFVVGAVIVLCVLSKVL